MRWIATVLAATAVLHAASDGPADVSAPLNSLLIHQQGEVRRLRPATEERSPVHILEIPDAGDIAVVDDGDGVGLPAFLFDLEGRTVSIEPVDLAARGYLYQARDGGYDANAAATGDFLTLGDDDSLAIPLPFTFPFFGLAYDAVYLNSDGNLTFNEGDSASTARDPARAVSGPPRICPFFFDLDPSRPGAAIRVASSARKWTATWINVPEWTSAGFGGRLQNFQVSLFPDGRIEFAYRDITLDLGIVGIASAENLQQSRLVDFSEPAAEPLTAAFVELFSPPDIDLSLLAQKFYLAHQDAYDVLVVFHDYEIPVETGAFAFFRGIRNFIQGIGPAPLGFLDQNLFDFGDIFGSPTRLQGLIYMGELDKYPADPNDRIDRGEGVGTNTTLAILAHEFGHRWLAQPLFVDPVGNFLSAELLGRQFAHWNWFFNTEGSFLEGNRIVDHGPEASPYRFETVEAAARFSPLDLYLMGLEPPEAVPPSFLVRQPDILSPAFSAGRQPLAGVFFDGERRDILMQDILRAMGRRTPDHTISQKDYRVGFVLLVEEGTEPSPENIAKIDRIRAGFETYFSDHVGGRADVQTELVSQLLLSTWPAAGVLQGETLEAAVFTPEPLGEDLVVTLEAGTGAVGVPDSVVIPAGDVVAIFPIEGLQAGVGTLTASAGESFETAHSSINVLGDRKTLALERLYLFEILFGDPRERLETGAVGAPLPYSILAQAYDRNALPYGDLAVKITASGDGFVTPAEPVTDSFGLLVFDWTLSTTPGKNTLRVEIEGSEQPPLILEATGSILPNRQRNPRRDLFR